MYSPPLPPAKGTPYGPLPRSAPRSDLHGLLAFSPGKGSMEMESEVGHYPLAPAPKSATADWCNGILSIRRGHPEHNCLIVLLFRLWYNFLTPTLSPTYAWSWDNKHFYWTFTGNNFYNSVQFSFKCFIDGCQFRTFLWPLPSLIWDVISWVHIIKTLSWTLWSFFYQLF